MRSVNKITVEILEKYPFSVSLVVFLLVFYPVQSVLGLQNNLEFGLDAFLRGEIWRMFTHPFIHGSISHVLFNSFIILVLGPKIEYRLGTSNIAVMLPITSIVIAVTLVMLSLKEFFGASAFAYFLFGLVVSRNPKSILSFPNSDIAQKVGGDLSNWFYPFYSFFEKDPQNQNIFRTIFDPRSYLFWAIWTLIIGWLTAPFSAKALGHTVGFIIGVLIQILISLKTVREKFLFG